MVTHIGRYHVYIYTHIKITSGLYVHIRNVCRLFGTFFWGGYNVIIFTTVKYIFFIATIFFSHEPGFPFILLIVV